jgi:hypothetical protein
MMQPVRTGLFAIAAAVFGLLYMHDANADNALDPGDHVAGHPSVTYFDLVKQIVPDLDSLPAQALHKAGEPMAHTIVPYRHIEGEDAKTVPEGPVTIHLLTARTIQVDGKSRLALLADLGPSDEAVAEFTLLALFDMTDQPKLLDVVEVGTDRLTGFAYKPLPLGPLGHGSDLIVIDSDHFNSNEDFVGTELLFVRNDRFRLIGSLSTFNVRTCTSRLTQTPVITTGADFGGRYREVHLAVRERLALEADSADCSGEKVPRPFKRAYRAAYRWNAERQRFNITSSDLKKLDRENSKLTSDGL